MHRCGKSAPELEFNTDAIVHASVVMLASARGSVMRRHGWGSLVALVAVLLHSAAFIYHNQVMLDAYSARQQLLGELTTLCHGGQRPLEVDAPTLPLPSEQSTGCLVCKGLISPFALPTSPAYAKPHAYAHAIERLEPHSRGLTHLIANLPPPARGPPA
jgi:hypothetical protein